MSTAKISEVSHTKQSAQALSRALIILEGTRYGDENFESCYYVDWP